MKDWGSFSHCGSVWLFPHCLLQRLISPIDWFGTCRGTSSKIKLPSKRRFISGLSILLFWPLYLSPWYHIVWITLALSFEIRWFKTSALFFFFKIVLNIPDPFHLNIKFRNQFVNLCKRGLLGLWLRLQSIYRSFWYIWYRFWVFLSTNMVSTVYIFFHLCPQCFIVFDVFIFKVCLFVVGPCLAMQFQRSQPLIWKFGLTIFTCLGLALPFSHRFLLAMSWDFFSLFVFSFFLFREVGEINWIFSGIPF